MQNSPDSSCDSSSSSSSRSSSSSSIVASSAFKSKMSSGSVSSVGWSYDCASRQAVLPERFQHISAHHEDKFDKAPLFFGFAAILSSSYKLHRDKYWSKVPIWVDGQRVVSGLSWSIGSILTHGRVGVSAWCSAVHICSYKYIVHFKLFAFIRTPSNLDTQLIQRCGEPVWRQ